jgi:hypothetical protein
VNELVSFEDRTRVELGSNRRRFARDGVSLVVGDAATRVALPIESRREIYVRPAWRGADRKPSWLELLLEKLFFYSK